jgi:hypothetical protein
MKMINRKFLSVALVMVMVLAGTLSCNEDFLVVAPTGSLTEDQVTSQQGLEKLLIGVYSVLNGRGPGWHAGASNWLWGSIRGAEANKGTNAGDFSSMNPVERFETETVNSEVHAKWLGSYEGVSRANILLANIAKSTEISDEVRTRITAEARFLRGHYYFELRKNFKMVPYVDETMDYATGATEVKNDVDIYPRIEDDFEYAYANLPETQSQVGRANKWAAGAYLAKVYLFQSKFTEAKDVFDDVINDGVTSDNKPYALAPNFANLFRLAGENSSESIFAFQATGGAQNTNNANQDLAMNYPYNTLPGNCCGFFAPSFELASSFRTDADGLPLLDGSYRLAANELKTDQGVASAAAFTPDAGNIDPRLDITLGRRGIPFLDWGLHKGFDWIRDQSYAGPYSPKKYSYSQAEDATRDGSGWTPGYIATNFMIIRFADVLLMAAEAEVEVGSLEQARAYVNMVRSRAANPAGFVQNGGGDAANYVIDTYNTTWTDQDDARSAVRFERKLELGLEGHRFYDLVRWGIVKAEVDAYFAYENPKIPSHFSGAVFTTGQDEYLPIPQRQIDLQGSDVLQQNDNY